MKSFKESWVDENVEKVLAVYPDEDESVVRVFVEQEYDEHFKDAKCIIYNNYEKEQITTTISKVTDWIRKVKPITTESGSLFKQHSQCWNPDTSILQGKLDERKVAKKKMLNYKDASKKAEDEKEKAELFELAMRFDLTQRRVDFCAII